jgi:hypothetical protein
VLDRVDKLIEEVGQSHVAPKWFQLYPWGDRAFERG